MKRFAMFVCCAVALVFATSPFAGEIPHYVDGHESVIHGGNPEMSKAASRDTVYLIGPYGSGALVNGQFQDASGAPDWNGWTSIDYTQKTEAIWYVDTYNVLSGSYSAWCGEVSYESCVPGVDPVGGYGPSYDEFLSWYRTVGRPNEFIFNA